MSSSRARKIILAKLKESQKTWGQLEDACKNEGLSRGAFSFQMKTLQDKEMIVQVSPSKGAPYCLSGKKNILQSADAAVLNLYLNILLENPSNEMVAEVLRDLKELCRERRIIPINHEREKKYFSKLLSSNKQEELKKTLRNESFDTFFRFWLFLAISIMDESYANHWENLIDCLRSIANNSLKTGDERTLIFLKKNYSDKIFQIIMTPEIEKRVRYQANMFIKLTLSIDEKFNELKMRIEEATFNIKDNEDERWGLTINPAYDIIMDVYKEKRYEVKNWIYQRFMKSDVKRVRRRGAILNSALRAPERALVTV